MKKILPITSFCLLLFLFIGCRHYTPYVGEIVVDADVPDKETELLPIGYTFNEGGGGRNLLSSDLIVNGDFEDGLEFWETIQARVTLETEIADVNQKNTYLKAVVEGNDSLSAIRQTLPIGAVKEGDQFVFQAQTYTMGNSSMEIALVTGDTLLNRLSSPLTITPSPAPWNRVKGRITVHQDAPQAYLYISFSGDSEPIMVTIDSIPQWRYRSGFIALDHLSLLPLMGESRADRLPEELVALLADLQPTFLRYPSGNKVNTASPILLDSIRHVSQKSGSRFGYQEFLSLSHRISAAPILLVPFGYDAKPDAILQLLGMINSPEGFIQLGYAQEGLEYFYRVHALEQYLKEQSLSSRFIISGSLLPYRSFSDYLYDRTLPLVDFPLLSELDSLIINHNYLEEPQILGEIHFRDAAPDLYSLPPLALRAAALTILERNSTNLEGIGIAPLLSDELEKDFPIILVRGGRYEPTVLYRYLQLFTTLRGGHLKSLPMNELFDNGLVLSLTTDAVGEHFYLKAVNTTRHPLHYLIKLKGRRMAVTKCTAHSFAPSATSTSGSPADFFDYAYTTEELPVGRGFRLDYRFAPYEVVLFHLR